MNEQDKIIAEYETLLRNWKHTYAALERKLNTVTEELRVANANAAKWEEIAKLGYPDVITHWMDSLSELESCAPPEMAGIQMLRASVVNVVGSWATGSSNMFLALRLDEMFSATGTPSVGITSDEAKS